MFCCPNCFNDQFLKDQIKILSKVHNNCSFCDSENVPCINPYKLNEYFSSIIYLYAETEDSEGRNIEQLLEEDWLLFGNLSNSKRSDLLCVILDDDSFHSNKFKRIISSDLEQIKRWDDFRNELKHENRYFPQKSPLMDHLKNLFEYLIYKIKKDTDIYRARINSDTEIFHLEEMGKPPNKKVGNGRANPVGISYFYAASDEETAIAEIRPYIGNSVTVAKFKITEQAIMVDLRNPRETISPFMIDEDDLLNLYKDIGYLNRLGDELSKPIIPKEANLEYLPSQYLCEMIKLFNYDGVIYKSSVAKGYNLAFFNDDKLTGISTQLFKITKVIYNSELW